MPTLKPKTKVVLNKDIRRIENRSVEWPEDFCPKGICDECNEKYNQMQTIRYAANGDTGIVLETFKAKRTSGSTFGKGKNSWYVKVIMDDGSGCKTFRITSLDVAA